MCVWYKNTRNQELAWKQFTNRHVSALLVSSCYLILNYIRVCKYVYIYINSCWFIRYLCGQLHQMHDILWLWGRMWRRGCRNLTRCRISLVKSLLEMPDLGIHSNCEAYLSLLSCFRSFSRPHALVSLILFIVLDLLYDMVIHWIDQPLVWHENEIRKIACGCYEKCDYPENGSGSKGFFQN